MFVLTESIRVFLAVCFSFGDGIATPGEDASLVTSRTSPAHQEISKANAATCRALAEKSAERRFFLKITTGAVGTV